MAKLAFVATHGSENPTKACFPFLQAKNAVEAGMEVELSLIGDAVVLHEERGHGERRSCGMASDPDRHTTILYP